MAQKTKNNGTTKEFWLNAPKATRVMLAGDFTDWAQRAIVMKHGKNGDWKATVTLPPGRHEYRFIVDDEWADDPQCLEREQNPFGTTNSVCTVG
ncbi:MAG: isoamylase early set domain-containing protein [Limisphaerales bacterium]